ncbi:MAG: hypothetical protein EU540_00310 [Promethearchaeota archaeon]|nr:MAG: hypothetical protein EU540_00310 [Candidatus Lokiarchaeota archaeon]
MGIGSYPSWAQVGVSQSIAFGSENGMQTSEEIQTSECKHLNKYQKVLIEFFQKKASANSIYPNPAVTGTSGYKNMDYKRNKANRIERNAWEKYEYAKNKLGKAINLYLSRKIQNTPKTIDFTAENLNQEIAKIRKQFKPELKTIKKAFGGTTKGRKRSNYFLEFEKEMFRLEINEFGNYVFHPYDDYRNLKNRSFNSVREMMEQLKIDIKTTIKRLNL